MLSSASLSQGVVFISRFSTGYRVRPEDAMQVAALLDKLGQNELGARIRQAAGTITAATTSRNTTGNEAGQ